MTALEQVAHEVCRVRSDTTGPTCPTRKRAHQEGDQIIRLVAHLRFLILAALCESWSLPFSVLLTVLLRSSAFPAPFLRGYDPTYSQID